VLKQNVEYLTSTVVTIVFSILYGILEYYWIITDRDVPFRYGNQPIFLGFNTYHLTIMLPILILVAFGPFFDDLFLKLNPMIEKWYTSFLGGATTFFAMMIEDITWFVCRVVNPLKLDGLANKWIQIAGPDGKPEWTARWAYLAFDGNAVPIWYFLVAIFSIASWAFIFTRKSGKEFARKLVAGFARKYRR